jgi:phenylpropionate dioxygenase-like ring-hydroxylating dioxygenase large terminal subunit
VTTETRDFRPVKHEETPYEAAVLGFKNYWYPVFSSTEIGKKPVGATIQGEPVVFMRGQADGKVYAMTDECAHRGTQFSAGRGCEFAGTNTITCPYHGWTFELGTGMCVAVLPEGPDSKVPGKLRIKTYPIEDFKGIIWIWMGDMKPVPLEDDLPGLMKLPTNIVKFRYTDNYGNWRWHAENVVAGHAQMVHRDSIRMWFVRTRPATLPAESSVQEDVDGIGVHQAFGARDFQKQMATTDVAKLKTPPSTTEFPGLGRWYVPPLWRRVMFWPWLRKVRRGTFGSPVQGVTTGKIMLPGFYRQPHFPSAGNVYYEWYVAQDEDHYRYSQVSVLFPKGPIDRVWKHLWYYMYSLPISLINFNNQDKKFSTQTTNFTKRRKLKIYPMTRLSANDHFHTIWRQFANENARGVGTAYQNGTAPAAQETIAQPEAQEIAAEVRTPIGVS